MLVCDCDHCALLRRSLGKWVKTGRSRTGCSFAKEALAAEAPPAGKAKHSSVLLAEKVAAAIVAASDAVPLPIGLPPSAQYEELRRCLAPAP